MRRSSKTVQVCKHVFIPIEVCFVQADFHERGDTYLRVLEYINGWGAAPAVSLNVYNHEGIILFVLFTNDFSILAFTEWLV